jgi:hypothetical protein
MKGRVRSLSAIFLGLVNLKPVHFQRDEFGEKLSQETVSGLGVATCTKSARR